MDCPQSQPIDPRARLLLLAFRQALLIVLGALEDYIGIQRSVIPKHERQKITA